MKITWTKGAEDDMKKLFSSNPIYAVPRFFKDTWYEVKWGFQRMFRGYDDRMYFSTYHEIAKIMIPVLKWYKEHKTGYGWMEHFKEDISMADMEKEWNDAYLKMAVAFQLLFDDNEATWAGTNEEVIQDGLQLFATHFRNLWD